VKLPRDLSGQDLARAPAVYGYAITRQAGSHMRLTTQLQGEHHLTIPDHASLRVGTLAAILTEVAHHFQPDRSAIADKLFS
jgi:predicted RNA binding protein YcfA (HicA-like mRNA interferase family)